MRRLADRQAIDMSARGSGKWRWAAVALLIAALGTSVAIVLHTAGLSGAANFAQLLTLVLFIPPAVNWARSKASSEQHRSPDEQPTPPGQGATAFSPKPQIPDAAETRSSDWETYGAPEQVYSSYGHENATNIGGPRGTPKPARRWAEVARRTAWPIIVLAVLIFILIEGSLQYGDDGSGSTYTVPQIYNLPVGKAIAEIKAAGLTPDIVSFPFCLPQFTPAGTVVTTDPISGEGISKGGTVQVDVCTGISLPVPQVIDLPLSTAIQQLANYAFNYTIHYSLAPAAENIPTGVVWKQNPKPQATDTIGDAVTLWVQSKQ